MRGVVGGGVVDRRGGSEMAQPADPGECQYVGRQRVEKGKEDGARCSSTRLSLVMTLQPMTTSILLHSPSPSPSPVSTPLPALQMDLSSSSSSSASGSCPDLHPSSSAPSSRRIRFAPLPDPRRDLLFDDPSADDPQPDSKPSPEAPPAPSDLPDGFVTLLPSVSPVSTLSSACSTPTIRISPNAPSKNTRKSGIKRFRPFSFLRNSHSSSPSQPSLPPSHSLPDARNLSRSASSLPSSPTPLSTMLPRFSAEDILSGTKSLFRSRSGSASSTRSSRSSSPPPKSSDPSKSLQRSASTGSGPGMTLGSGKRDWGEGSSQSHTTFAIAGSGPKKRRASSSALTPGAGGGRHACSVKSIPNEPPRASTAPSSPTGFPKKHVKMLNGRIYGGKRYAGEYMHLSLFHRANILFSAQTLANPFANVREDPEFVEWGYGGMGSVHASAGIANDMWKGLQRSERGSALLAGPSIRPSTRPATGAVTAGGGRGSGASATLPLTRRKMSDSVPECGMASVSAGGGGDEDDGSGMGWVKRRRAEREAKTRLEQQAKELNKNPQEGRRSCDSVDASMYASTASTATLLTACTSAASTNMTTPASSPLASKSPSLVGLNLSSPTGSDDPCAAPRIVTGEQSEKSDILAHPTLTSKEEHEHHVLTAVRLSPSISTPSPKHSHSATHERTPSLSRTLSQIGKDTDYEKPEEVAPLSPVDSEETSANLSGDDDEEPNRGFDEEEVDEEVQVSRSPCYRPCMNILLYRIPGRLRLELASRKLVDTSTSKRGKRTCVRPRVCTYVRGCAWVKGCLHLVQPDLRVAFPDGRERGL